MKTSSKWSGVKYFEDRISDGVKTVRLVSFEPNAQTSKAGVALRNCAIKRSCVSDNFEVHLNNKNGIVSSPKKFKVLEEEVTMHATCSSVLGTLEELKDVAEHQRISISGKVVAFLSPVEQIVMKGAGKHLSKRELKVADGTAACRCVIWENHIDQVEEDKCYTFENATVRSFNGAKYVSVGEKAIISAIDEIGYVVDDASCDETGGIVVVKAEIVEVVSMENYSSCRNCHGKVMESANQAIGECTKCGSKVKLMKSKRQNVARVILLEEGDKEYKVTMFGDVIENVVHISGQKCGNENGDVSELLVLSPQLSYTLNLKKETVCLVTHTT